MQKQPQDEIYSSPSEMVSSEFDYSSVPDVADQLRAAAERIRNLLNTSAFDIGKELRSARSKLGHGQFHRWVEAESPFSIRTAQNMMVAARWAESKSAKIARMRVSAIVALSQKSTPPEVIEHVLSRLEADEIMPPRDVFKLIRDAQAKKVEQHGNKNIPVSQTNQTNPLQPAKPKLAEAGLAQSEGVQAAPVKPEPQHHDGPTPSAAQPEQPAESAPPRSEAVQGTPVQRQAEISEVVKPPAPLPKRDEETAFPWEAGARQLIDRLMTGVLTVEGEIPEEASIHGLLKYCSLGEHAERLSKRPRTPIEITEPAAAEKTQRSQDLTPALQVPDQAGVKHPPNSVRIEWEIEARIIYWRGRAGTELPVSVKKIADGHIKIVDHPSKESSRHTNARRTRKSRRGNSGASDSGSSRLKP